MGRGSRIGVALVNGYIFGPRSEKELRFVHPKLVEVARLALALSHWDFAVIEGLRTIERQRELYARGSSDTMFSKHLKQATGWAHALDVCAVGDLDSDGDIDAQDKKRTWDPPLYTDIAGCFFAAAEELGVEIEWGGHFKRHNGISYFDGPHFQLVKV